ncbi:hypothetical protein QIS74_04101 [Colletotrichum tabaci]|uniref:Uncharacterized protein n=1 Tax=Colletotrichum tabaci TaxID=1209068 RepID=A0AAV9TMR5_9PEZI
MNSSIRAHGAGYSQNTLIKPNYAEPQDAPIEVNTVRWGLPIGKRTNFTSFDPEVADAAWATRGISHHQGWLKMSTEELASIRETSVEFKSGGHLVGMDVFHQLHCLNYLRKKLDGYKEGYPNIPEDEQIPPRFHIGQIIHPGMGVVSSGHLNLSALPIYREDHDDI